MREAVNFEDAGSNPAPTAYKIYSRMASIVLLPNFNPREKIMSSVETGFVEEEACCEDYMFDSVMSLGDEYYLSKNGS